MRGLDSKDIRRRIRDIGAELGFAAVGFTRAEIGAEARRTLRDWLAASRHGGMDYMARHAALREQPAELHPGTVSVISVRMNYWPDETQTLAPGQVLADPALGYVSRYALGRDYHKTLRQRLQTFSERIAAEIGPFGHRVFVDSAPVMEVEFARQAALGWRGKHTLLLTRQGSWHFLGELYTDLPLPADAVEPPATDHCGTCTHCIDACPTQAIVAPYQVDARRCISYLTIEHPGSIPEALRPLLGNRIYGCDDCQLCCPWNRFGQVTREVDFAVRNALDRTPLSELFAWSETEFNDRLGGSPIRRIGHSRWRRNIAVALGNALREGFPAHAPRHQGQASPAGAPDVAPEHAAESTALRATLRAALESRRDDADAMVREHVSWALSTRLQKF